MTTGGVSYYSASDVDQFGTQKKKKKKKNPFIDECADEDGDDGDDDEDDDKASDISNLIDDEEGGDTEEDDDMEGMEQYFQYQSSQDSTPNVTPTGPVWKTLMARYGRKT